MRDEVDDTDMTPAEFRAAANEPMFTIPLSKLVDVGQDGHLDWGFDCLCDNHWGYWPDSSREEAVQRAIEHLAKVHDMHPRPKPVKMEPIRRPESYDAYEGRWIAARGDDVVFDAASPAELVRTIAANPCANKGLIIQYVHPPSDVIEIY